MLQLPGLYIADTKDRGRGVFTASDISKGDKIEICPALIIPTFELPILHRTTLHDYYFLWGDENEMAAIALGLGSIYNHSYTPNSNFLTDMPEKTIDIFAIKDIKAGEEITINYNGSPEDKERLWF